MKFLHFIFSLFFISLTSQGEALKPTAKSLLCVPEAHHECKSNFKKTICKSDPEANTLVAWKIDLNSKSISLCNRSGEGCGESAEILITEDDGTGYLIIISKNSYHPDVFKIRGMDNKFTSIRLSGDAGGLDPKIRMGTCVRLK